MRKKSPLGDLGVLKVTILSAQTTRFTQSTMVEMGRYLCFPGFSISSKFHRQVSHHPLQRFFFQLLIHVEFQVCQSFALHRLPIRKSFTSRPCFFAVTANRRAFHAFSYSFVSRIILNFKFRNLFFCKTQIL